MSLKKSIEELQRMEAEEYRSVEKLPLVVVMDNVRSKHNVGSIFRTSDAFLIKKIYLCGITETPPDKEIEKTALGSTESVAWEKFEDSLTAIKQLKEEGYIIISIEQTHNSKMLEEMGEISKDQKIAIVLGHEVFGVSEEIINMSDICIEIPQFGTKHSLNVSVCGGIAIWEFFKKMRR